MIISWIGAPRLSSSSRVSLIWRRMLTSTISGRLLLFCCLYLSLPSPILSTKNSRKIERRFYEIRVGVGGFFSILYFKACGCAEGFFQQLSPQPGTSQDRRQFRGVLYQRGNLRLDLGNCPFVAGAVLENKTVKGVYMRSILLVVVGVVVLIVLAYVALVFLYGYARSVQRRVYESIKKLDILTKGGLHEPD